jgi:Ca-activated chloride channel family protein
VTDRSTLATAGTPGSRLFSAELTPLPVGKLVEGSHRVRSLSLAVIALVCQGIGLAGQSPATQERPMFRGGVDLVAMTAVVRDGSGRPVKGLARADFELLDAGERRSIVDFSAERAPASVAILLDVSGSMEVASKLSGARDAMGHMVSWLDSGTDEVAIYTFDSSLRVQHPFTPVSPEVTRQLPPLEAFGMTSLYDAIAQVGQRVAAQGRARQVIVVVTDGIDTSSQLSATEVSRMASEIDVPVYVIAVVTSLDDPGKAPRRAPASTERPLEILAQRTGGLLFVASTPAHASLAARQIAAELHQWYQLSFEPGSQPGWHALTLRTRQKGLLVRARSGYVAGNESTRKPQIPSER